MTDKNKDTAAAPTSSLRRLWLALTGGEQGCPRKRFFLTILPVATVEVIATKCYIASQATALFTHGYPTLAGILLAPCLFLSNVGAGLFKDNISLIFRACGLWEKIPLPESQPDMGYMPGTGLSPLWVIPCALVLLLSSSVLIGLVLRRLRDAGCSRWNLLAGLWSTLFFLLSTFCTLFPSADAFFAELIVFNLGNLWLLWIYCQPTRAKEE